MDFQKSNHFFFWLCEGDASQQGNRSSHYFISSYFNITDKQLSTSTPLPSSSATSTSTLSTNITSLPSTASDEGSSQDSGLSPGVVAGIAVGSCVGIAAIIGIFYWISRLSKTQKKLVARLEQLSEGTDQQQDHPPKEQHIHRDSSLLSPQMLMARENPKLVELS